MAPMDLEQNTFKRHKNKRNYQQKAQWTQDKRPLEDTNTKENVGRRSNGLSTKDPQKTQKQMKLLAKGLMDLKQKTKNHKRILAKDN